MARKMRLGEFEIITLTQECSHMLHNEILQKLKEILQKLKDRGNFTISCSIRTKYSGKTLCNLGANINLMPLSMFK